MPKSEKPRFHDAKWGSAITVHLHFGAASNRIEKVLSDGTLQIGLTIQKGDPEVDDELLRFLSKLFQASLDQFEIIGARNSSNRLVSIIGIGVDQVQKIVSKVANIPS